LYERYSPRHPSCYHLRIEQVEVEGMDMSEVEGMNMVEEQDHPTNHRLGEEGMNMVGNNMVEVDGMDMMEEHFHLMSHRRKWRVWIRWRAFPPDEPPIGGGGYGYSGYWYGGE
jgi:hypothetical protein